MRVKRAAVAAGVTVLLVCVTGIVQYNVQRAHDRVDAMAEHLRALRDENAALRQRSNTEKPSAAAAAATTTTTAPAANCSSGGGYARVEEAFLLFVELDRGTPGPYVKLARVLIKSILTFSTRPVVLYGATADTEDPAGHAAELRAMVASFGGDRVQLRWVRPAPQSLFFSKLKAVIASGISCGVYVDTDAVVNYRVDDLFATCQARRAPYPLLVAHNNDPANQGPVWGRGGSGRKSAPYAWAASFIWSEEALPFLLDVYERCMARDFNRANFDETALNTLMWERGITEQACVYATYPRAGELEAWYTAQSWPADARYSVHDIVAFHVSSGGKDPAKSEALFKFYLDGAARGLRVYYNQRTGRWLDASEAGLCVVRPPLEESRAKAEMLLVWTRHPWEERRGCCADNPNFAAANLP